MDRRSRLKFASTRLCVDYARVELRMSIVSGVEQESHKIVSLTILE